MFLRYFLKRLLLLSVKRSLHSTNSIRYLAYYYLVRLPRISSKTFINKRCCVTGRVWGTNKVTNLSRFELRNRVYQSYIPGLRRSSW